MTTIYIDVDGENLVKTAFLEIQLSTDSVNVDTHCNNVDINKPSTLTHDVDGENQENNGIVTLLKETLDTLRKQLEVKDIQIAALTEATQKQADTIDKQASAIMAAQALHAGTIQNQLTSGTDRDDEAPLPQQAKKGWRFWKK